MSLNAMFMAMRNFARIEKAKTPEEKQETMKEIAQEKEETLKKNKKNLEEPHSLNLNDFEKANESYAKASININNSSKKKS